MCADRGKAKANDEIADVSSEVSESNVTPAKRTAIVDVDEDDIFMSKQQSSNKNIKKEKN